MNALNPLTPDKRGADHKAYEPSMEEILASIRRIIADDQAFAQRQTAPQEPVTDAVPAASVSESEVEPVPLRTSVGPKQGPVSKEELLKARAALETATPHKPTSPRAPVTPPRAPTRPVAPSLSASQNAQSPALEPRMPVAAAAPPRPSASIAPFPVEAQFPFFKAAAVPREIAPSPAAAERLEQSKPRSDSGDGAANVLRPSPEQVIAPQPVQAPPPSQVERVVEELPLVSPATDASVSSSFNALIASQFLQSGEVVNDMVREMLRPMLKAWLDDNLPVLVERLVRAEIERVARGGR